MAYVIAHAHLQFHKKTFFARIHKASMDVDEDQTKF